MLTYQYLRYGAACNKNDKYTHLKPAVLVHISTNYLEILK